ncbi:MAG TPA: SRPBCC family protein, partial [Ktedonobacteraceae bacterium]|nr:SRPBCC family protein [Ktedonobacteraceae bacterium]
MADMIEPNGEHMNKQHNDMVERHASVTVNAPLAQVYQLFTHFNDFPKYMHFIDQVTYIDDQRSHWVADVAGHHEWDAINQGWVENRQVGWRSYNGLENEGKVTFQPAGQGETLVDVYISYKPPAGFIGDLVEKMGVGSKFEHDLQHDLENFALMVEATPQQHMDP